MKLLTAAIIKKLEKAPLYSIDGQQSAPVIVKFFSPWSNWTWYAFEGSPTCPDCGAYNCDEGHSAKSDFTFFGLVEGHEKELGYFTLEELEGVRGPGGLRIERDMYFDGYVLNKSDLTVARGK